MSENVSTLIGVLLDVSYSMRSSIGDGVHEDGGDWVRSLFQVIDNLIKHDVSASNHVFAIGFGSKLGNGIFDIIHTLEHPLEQGKPLENQTRRSYEDTVDRILQILKDGGAVAVRKWATVDIIRRVVSHEMSTKILHELETKPDFIRKFVNDFLPSVCKGAQSTRLGRRVTSSAPIFGLLLLQAGESAFSHFLPATEEDINLVIKKAESYFAETVKMENVIGSSPIYSVHKASEILHGCADEESLTKERAQVLFDTVEPFIYGGTHFYTSLQLALDLFSCPSYQDRKKLLFVVSNGEPGDDGSHKDEMVSQLRQKGVTTVGCFITRSANVEPRKLFSKTDDSWEKGAKFLFELSSKLTTQLLPRTIFIKRGWKIEIDNNETKLFLQVNHPDIMKDACNLARDVVCRQDALVDILATVSLDLYINQNTDGLVASQQVGKTCYANASAAVLHLSMKRILGRDGGYPDFDELKDDLIKRFGKLGAKTFHVLKSVCPEYRLHCKKVTLQGAMAAVTAKRPVVARFGLTKDEWDVFSRFYENNRTGILTRKDLDISKRLPGDKAVGHAVVLTSFNSEHLRMMNSRGLDFGDDGFFRVQNAEVLGLKFIDVFWTENDLTTAEKEYYAKHGADEGKKFINNLKGLQFATYKCPKCEQTSKVTEYSGQLVSAKCPKCKREFKCDGEGNILALNMYLTSLSR